MPRTGIDTEFVVAATEVLHKGAPGADYPCRVQLFEPAHRSQPGLQPAMIRFDRIVGILLDDVAGGGHQFLDCARVGRRPVGAHLSRAGAVLEGAGEEPAGGRKVPLLGHQDVDDLSALVDRSIQVDSSSGDFEVGFVDEPAIAWSVPAGLSRVDEQQCEPPAPIDTR